MHRQPNADGLLTGPKGDADGASGAIECMCTDIQSPSIQSRHMRAKTRSASLVSDDVLRPTAKGAFADRPQCRHSRECSSAEQNIGLRIHASITAAPAGAARGDLHALWEPCRSASSAQHRAAEIGVIEDGVQARYAVEVSAKRKVRTQRISEQF
jgi:hypothetical protein